MRAPDTIQVKDIFVSEEEKVIYLPYNYTINKTVNEYLYKGYHIQLEIV